MDTIVEEVLRSPRARLYVDEMDAALRREDAARQRFRDELRDEDKAEFINGEVIVHSAARWEHSRIVGHVGSLLSTYAQVHKVGTVVIEKALVALTRNDYEPDVCFWRTETAAKFEPKQMLFPAPDLVVEVISPSTEHRDRGVKFDDYAAHGITEYWIIDPEARAVEQYILDGSRYQRIAVGTMIVKSVAMKGVEIPVEAFFDDAANLTALRRLLA